MSPLSLSSLALIGLSIGTGVAGQTVIKLGLNRRGQDVASPGLVGLVKMILKSPLVILGLLFYGIGALSWIAALARLDLSVAYPFLALNFVLIALSSRIFLGERIPPLRWLGIGVICAGILLVASSV